VATRRRRTSLDPLRARFRDEYRTAAGVVRYVDDDDVVPVVSAIWDRFRRGRAGEVGRSDELQRYHADRRRQPQGPRAPVAYLAHADGYAAYRMEDGGTEGHPALTMHLIELAAVTPDAHAALWQRLLGVDFVADLRSYAIPPDDPLPFLLEDQRALRTRDDTDGLWLNVRDIPTAFGARTYRTSERLVVEVDGRRWAIEGGPDGGSCRAVRTRPDLVTSHGWFSALLYGGVLPSALVAGRRMTARSAEAVARADVFFTTSLAPYSQDYF